MKRQERIRKEKLEGKRNVGRSKGRRVRQDHLLEMMTNPMAQMIKRRKTSKKSPRASPKQKRKSQQLKRTLIPRVKKSLRTSPNQKVRNLRLRMILSQKARNLQQKEKESEKTEGGPPKDEEPAETWAEVIRKTRPARQVKTAAAEKANARTYPTPVCDSETKPNYTYKRADHVSPRNAAPSVRWTKDKPRVVPGRNPVQLVKNTVHKAIL